MTRARDKANITQVATTTEPSPLTAGMVWIDTDATSTNVFEARWRKSYSSAVTTISGLDDYSLTLSYTVGFEKVFLNGVLLTRAVDYTATDGTSIVLAASTNVGDYIDIVTTNTFNAANTYTQAQTNAAFYPVSTTTMAGKNAVINGGMDIWQRGTSFSFAASTAASTSTFTADRWQTATGTNQAITVSRQLTNDTTNLPFIQYCLRYQRNSGQTGTSNLYLVNNFETVNSIPFAGKTVTLSFYARKGADYSPSNSLLNIYLDSGTGTDQNPYNGYTGGAGVINSSVTLTTTWQRFSFTATVGSGVKELSVYPYMIPTGTAGTNDYYEITGVQLELGSVATAFSRAGGDIAGELVRCQRYYWLTATGSGSPIYTPIGNFMYITTTQVRSTIPFPVSMRITPSLVITSGAYYMLELNNQTVSTMSINVANQNSANIYGTTSGSSTAGYASTMYISNASGSIAFNAEL